MTTPIIPQQVDREAARAFLTGELMIDAWASHDHRWLAAEDLIVRFAHHAQQARLEEREKIAAWIESQKYGDIPHDHETEQHDGTCDEFAIFIRNGTHAIRSGEPS